MDSHLDYVISLLNLMMIDSIVVNIDCCQSKVELYYLTLFILLFTLFYVNICRKHIEDCSKKYSVRFRMYWMWFERGDVDFKTYTVTV